MSLKEFYKQLLSFFLKRKFQVLIFLLLGSVALVFGLISPYLSAKLLQAITVFDPNQILFLAFLNLLYKKKHLISTKHSIYLKIFLYYLFLKMVFP